MRIMLPCHWQFFRPALPYQRRWACGISIYFFTSQSRFNRAPLECGSDEIMSGSVVDLINGRLERECSEQVVVKRCLISLQTKTPCEHENKYKIQIASSSAANCVTKLEFRAANTPCNIGVKASTNKWTNRENGKLCNGGEKDFSSLESL